MRNTLMKIHIFLYTYPFLTLYWIFLIDLKLNKLSIALFNKIVEIMFPPFIRETFNKSCGGPSKSFALPDRLKKNNKKKKTR